jgi:TM2 domain-containing membrane protein YozV
MATCANHPQTGAAAYCRTCGKPLCDQCKRDVRGVIYCEECLAARVGDPAMAGAVPPPIPGTAATPGSGNPVLAAILGFLFPGVGAMYNGQFAKALVHVGVFILLIKLTDDTNGLFGLGIAAWIFYMAFDAYHTARARQLGMPAPDFLGINRLFGIKEDPRYAAAPVAGGEVAAASAAEVPDRGVPMGAYWLIGIGAFLLLVFNLDLHVSFWTVLGIALTAWGGFLIYQRVTGARSYCQCQRCKTCGLMGPAAAATFGVLLILQGLHVARFGRLLPLVLIVLGAVRLVQMSASGEGHVDYVPPLVSAPGTPATPSSVESNSTTTGGV